MLTPQGVAELEQILARLKAQGLAVIFITHKLHEAISMGDRVSVLSQGRLVGRDRARGAALRRRHEELQERIVALMFGGAGRSEAAGRGRAHRRGRSGTRRSARSTPSRRSSSRA